MYSFREVSSIIGWFVLLLSLANAQDKGFNHELPPGVELINPKDLGLSDADLGKFLGNVKVLGGGQVGDTKTQILTVGFDGDENLNLDDFDIPGLTDKKGQGNLGDKDKEIANVAFEKFKEFFKDPKKNGKTYDEVTQRSLGPFSPSPNSFSTQSQANAQKENQELQKRIKESVMKYSPAPKPSAQTLQQHYPVMLTQPFYSSTSRPVQQQQQQQQHSTFKAPVSTQQHSTYATIINPPPPTYTNQNHQNQNPYNPNTIPQNNQNQDLNRYQNHQNHQYQHQQHPNPTPNPGRQPDFPQQNYVTPLIATQNKLTAHVNQQIYQTNPPPLEFGAKLPSTNPPPQPQLRENNEVHHGHHQRPNQFQYQPPVQQPHQVHQPQQQQQIHQQHQQPHQHHQIQQQPQVQQSQHQQNPHPQNQHPQIQHPQNQHPALPHHQIRQPKTQSIQLPRENYQNFNPYNNPQKPRKQIREKDESIGKIVRNQLVFNSNDQAHTSQPQFFQNAEPQNKEQYNHHEQQQPTLSQSPSIQSTSIQRFPQDLQRPVSHVFIKHDKHPNPVQQTSFHPRFQPPTKFINNFTPSAPRSTTPTPRIEVTPSMPMILLSTNENAITDPERMARLRMQQRHREELRLRELQRQSHSIKFPQPKQPEQSQQPLTQSPLHEYATINNGQGSNNNVQQAPSSQLPIRQDHSQNQNQIATLPQPTNSYNANANNNYNSYNNNFNGQNNNHNHQFQNNQQSSFNFQAQSQQHQLHFLQSQLNHEHLRVFSSQSPPDLQPQPQSSNNLQQQVPFQQQQPQQNQGVGFPPRFQVRPDPQQFTYSTIRHKRGYRHRLSNLLRGLRWGD